MTLSKYIFFFFCLVFTRQVFAQSQVDSLKRLLENTQNTDDKIQLLFDIAWEYKSSDPFQALEYANQCKELSESLEDKLGVSSSYSVMGVTYRIIGDFEKALENSLAALEIVEEIEDPERTAIALNNVGNVYYYMSNYNDALVYYQKALDIKNTIGDEMAISSSLNNIANVYRDIGKLDSSLLYHKQSLEIDIKTQNKLGEAMNRNNIGMVYSDKGMPEIAQPYLRQSIVLLEGLNEVNNLVFAYNSLAMNSILLDSLDLAEEYANKCLILSKKIGLKKEMRAAYLSLSKTFEKRNDFDNALKYYKDYTYMNDSILNESVQQKVSELEIKYGVHKQQKENTFLSQKNEIQKLTINNRTYLLVALFTFIVLISFGALFLFQRYKYRNKLRVNELEQKFLRSRMNPHFLFNALGSIQSCILSENTDLAYEYHSKFAKLLRLILLHSDEDVVPLKDDLEALKLYMELERFRTEDKFDFSIDVDPGINPNNTKIPPMLLQPFVENAIWHGVLPKKEKGFISIRISLNKRFLVCEIIDNGVGLHFKKKSKENKHKSLGLEITKTRLQNHNNKLKHTGILELKELVNENGTPCGTKVTLEIAF